MAGERTAEAGITQTLHAIFRLRGLLFFLLLLGHAMGKRMRHTRPLCKQQGERDKGRRNTTPACAHWVS